MTDILKEWDRELFIFLNGLGLKRLDGFWIYVTQIESWIPLFLLFIFLFYYYYNWKNASSFFYFLMLSFGLTILFTGIVKGFFTRVRPNNVEALSELIRILQKPTNYSFFSGHASSSFSVTVFVVLALRKKTRWIYLAFIWPLLFILSRIYVGVHYPSDLLVGALVGTLFAYALYLICKVRIEDIELEDAGDG